MWWANHTPHLRQWHATVVMSHISCCARRFTSNTNPPKQPGQIRGDERSSRCLQCAVNKPPWHCWLWQCWMVPLMFLWTPPVPILSPYNLKPESYCKKVCLHYQTHVHRLCAIQVNKWTSYSLSWYCLSQSHPFSPFLLLRCYFALCRGRKWHPRVYISTRQLQFNVSYLPCSVMKLYANIMHS